MAKGGDRRRGRKKGKRRKKRANPLEMATVDRWK